MSQKKGRTLDEKISNALDDCLGKMADRLSESFNPEEKESLQLFKQFCLALNARRQWMKHLEEKSGDSPKKQKGMQNLLQKLPNNQQSGSNKLDDLLKSRKDNSPLRPQDRQNGLVMRS
ncbi:MAG: hypothetical protein JXR73_01085 [Candidatus Omnitrophica bacterium]|nr:hypothetical protein [Candidatus Omnitrophota bacterium]